MSYPESALLNLLQPGEFIRFVFRPDGEGKIDVCIEGGADAGAELFEERLGMVLGRLRSQGYLFGQGARRPVGAPGEAPSRWVEVRPQAAQIHPLRGGEIGFGAKDAKPGKPKLWLPELLSEHPVGLGAPIAAACSAAHLGIQAIEIEFVRKVLSPEDAPLLECVLNSHSIARFRVGTRPPVETPAEAFLTLWLLHRSGWRVSLRAMIGRSAPAPMVHLEMMGEDLFLCPCEVSEFAEEPQPEDTLDLARLFPHHWPFPRLTWHNPEDKVMCRIYVREAADFTNEALWPQQFEWLRQKQEAMFRAFAPIAKQLREEG